MERTDGQVTGACAPLLRLEGLGLMLAALWAYAQLHGDRRLFAELFLAPDLSFAAGFRRTHL